MYPPSEVLGIMGFLLLVAGLARACGKITGGRATGQTRREKRHQGGK